MRATGSTHVLNAVDPRFVMPIFDGVGAAGATYLDMAMSLSHPHPDHSRGLLAVAVGRADEPDGPIIERLDTVVLQVPDTQKKDDPKGKDVPKKVDPKPKDPPKGKEPPKKDAEQTNAFTEALRRATRPTWGAVRAASQAKPLCQP